MESEMAYTTLNAFLADSRPQHAGLLNRIGATLRLWRQRSRDRAELARLTPRDARDLGIDPGQIAYETSKPFWSA
jgi:uncharacterized protein YjiS (DUF1127 family)